MTLTPEDRNAVELVKVLSNMEQTLESLQKTLTWMSEQLITLRNDIGDYQRDATLSRQMRLSLEQDQLVGEKARIEKTLAVLKSGPTTEEKIKAIVEREQKKKQINWMAVWQTVVQVMAGALALTLMWALLKLIVP